MPACWCACSLHQLVHLELQCGMLQNWMWLQVFRGHKDLVAGIAFRGGTGHLFSAGFDRAVKLWSVPDRAYLDSLFGHQSEVRAATLGGPDLVVARRQRARALLPVC